MRFSSVLFVIPDYTVGHYRGSLFPWTGVGYVAESLESAGVRCKVVDLNLGHTFADLKHAIDEFEPELIGISMKTYRYKYSYALAEDIKRDFPSIPLVAGGPHISTYRTDALAECSAVDFGVVLEGEQTMLELCQGAEYNTIKGLIYRQDGELAYTGDRPFCRDLDSIPFPRYRSFELEKYVMKMIPLVTSRGCPYSCTFCPVLLAIGRIFRFRSPTSVADEVEYWYHQGYREFGINDDNFTLLPNRVHQICDEIERRGLEDLEFRAGNGLRADRLDKALLGRMKDIGFKYISLGVESGSNKVLKAIKKAEDIETIEQVINDACQLGINVILFFIVGSPTETWEDFEKSVELALSYPVFDAKFYNLIPFPHTELFDYVSRNNLFLLQPEYYLNHIAHWDFAPVFETPEFPRALRVKALRYRDKVRKKVRRRAFARELRVLGPVAHLVAALVVTDLMQNYGLRSQWFYRFGKKVYDFFARF